MDENFFKYMTIQLVSDSDTVKNNSYSYSRRGQQKRCFKCGRKNLDLNLVEYRLHGRLTKHFLCSDCNNIMKQK